MPNIVHRIGIPNTTSRNVYDAVATNDGISKWWTTKISGKSKEGNVLEFKFGEAGPDFQVIKLEPTKKVEWKCVSGPPEWVDSHIEFEVSEQGNEIVLLFKHSGWRKEVEFMHHCSTQWAYFLIGLKDELSGIRKARPFGSDNFEPISHWSK
jgi:hypothetical protein